MSTSGKHCDLCQFPIERTVGCTNLKCPRNKAFAEKAKNDGVEIEMDLGTPTESPPPDGERRTESTSGFPTIDPPLTRALVEYLETPRSKREPWPDQDRCVDKACKRTLQYDFVFCPYCGRRREPPDSVREKAEKYGAAMARHGIGVNRPPSGMLPAIPPPAAHPSSTDLEPLAPSVSRQTRREESSSKYSIVHPRDQENSPDAKKPRR